MDWPKKRPDLTGISRTGDPPITTSPLPSSATQLSAVHPALVTMYRFPAVRCLPKNVPVRAGIVSTVPFEVTATSPAGSALIALGEPIWAEVARWPHPDSHCEDPFPATV